MEEDRGGGGNPGLARALVTSYCPLQLRRFTARRKAKETSAGKAAGAQAGCCENTTGRIPDQDELLEVPLKSSSIPTRFCTLTTGSPAGRVMLFCYSVHDYEPNSSDNQNRC